LAERFSLTPVARTVPLLAISGRALAAACFKRPQCRGEKRQAKSDKPTANS
jgi:hypothetical protein